jgi:TonB-dependent SusC/RagA subfamily outer membrane receptor
MKKMLLCSMLLMLCSFISNKSLAQPKDYATAKEKIYMHTNHVFFKPGEHLFFKIYLVNGNDQTPSTTSASVHVEVLNPSGNLVQKLSYRAENGYAEGSYDFPAEAVGGTYKLRAYTSWMQNEKDSSFYTKEITVQKVIAPRVLMKLDFPKKGYGAGDEVMADFSMRSLDNQPIKDKQASFTVSIGGKAIETNTFKTNYQGKAQVYFSLPKELTTNDGLLNIIINHDAYTEAISRSIPIVLNKIDLQFMPEGGTLVEGLNTNIAFKALNENGKAADIKGDVVDNRGNKVASLESYHFGMGSFAFTPMKGLFYKVRITSPTNIVAEYPLPMAVPNGVVMNIQQDKNGLQVILKTTSDMKLKLIGQTKSINFFSKDILLKKGQEAIQVDANKFPAGIAQFTLYSEGGMPLSERLVFLNSDKILQVKITTDKEKYQPREKVTLTLKTLDDKGQPIPSNFSMAVVDDKLWSFADDKQDHILSWLLMSSELKGKIEEPQFYFKKEEAKSIPALDLVMLTHGYRYFQFIEYVQESNKLKYSPDLGTVLSGTIVNKFNEPVKATVFLISRNNDKVAIKMKTDDDGVYCFPNLSANKYYYVLAKSQKEKEDVVIKVEQNGIGSNPIKAKLLKKVNLDNDEDFAVIKPFVKPLKDELKKQQNQAGFDMQMQGFGREQNLEDVVVTGYGTQKRKELTGSVATISAREINNIPIANMGEALQGRVAGLAITQAAGNPGAAANIRIRGAASITGNNEPLFVVNGVPMDRLNINNLNPNDIDNIEVLKDASATAIYGSRGANGVILIQSKSLKSEKIRVNLSKKSFFSSLPVFSNGPTYAVARRFYAPMYQSLETEERSDFRETIYWNPVVQTDKTGIAKIEFWNSDATTTFRAIAEGIAFNGKLGRTEATYAVQNAITVDAKIPPYLTVGDKALLPLNIKNNTTTDMEIFVEVDSVKKIKLGNYTKQITLEAGKAKQLLIPVEAIATMKGNIRFSISGQFSTETLVLPIEATGKGFPVIETFAGNSSTKHSFNINKALPGTLQSELKIFTNVEGRLLDGIESMLREPYGCFEQTSSSTYPNIFVLKYLRESNKLNPAIEKKALGYIEAGYKRLVGFETSEDGFEWFGKAPAHEALTAYGLLEFTDMQEFINVDKKMLERTKKFLMKKRNGDGTFKIASGGYDRFASVPNKIANVYIVYALTQAGVGKEIALEYKSAVKQAMESKDGYQMAMMALAASNMKEENDFAKLMQLLNESYNTTNLASETSVVNSRDASLRVEALALYSMALAREKSPNTGLMADLISKLINEKSYYGYGSTQATVLALNSVVTYAKLVGKITEEDATVDFMVNNKKADVGNAISEVLNDGQNSFTINYSNPKQTIPYQLQVSYQTFTPPNSAKAELKLSTKLLGNQTKVGETIRMEIEVKNEKKILQPMAIAKIGIPAGLSSQPWQLKEIMEKNQVAYYEIFDNYLVLYWMGFAVNETKKINLDLKAEIPGTYKAKASNTYLYYTPEHKHWNDGVEVEVKE